MTTPATGGIDPTTLDDETVLRELAHLHETRAETFFHGSEDALAAHTRRMLALESEVLHRFPDRVVPTPLRTRAGSRRAAGLG